GLLHGAVRLRQNVVERLLQARLERVLRRHDAALQPLALRWILRLALRVAQLRQLRLEFRGLLTHRGAQFLGLLLELLLRQLREAVRPGIDLVHERRQLLCLPLVSVTQDLVEYRLDHLTSVSNWRASTTPDRARIRRNMRGTLLIPAPLRRVQR